MAVEKDYWGSNAIFCSSIQPKCPSEILMELPDFLINFSDAIGIWSSRE